MTDLPGSRPTLYIDVDDTLIAECYPGSGFDLRPGVITQLRVLTRLFNCRWLTCWPRRPLCDLWKLLYAPDLNKNIIYENWEGRAGNNKLNAIFHGPEDWYWLEDSLADYEYEWLVEKGVQDRYIRVEPHGQWAFLDAVNELLRRAGIDQNHLKAVQAKPEWFLKP